MNLRDEEFPVVVQAYDPSGSKDSFVAEQVVYTQTEIDHFTSRYAGLLIKARELREVETNGDVRAVPRRPRKTRSGNAVGWVLFVLVVIIGLLVWGFATGWIQQNFGITPPI
ncbi:MAG TPA: hypothetical protein VEV87_06220 [Chitinophagaceae bacterium]|nr:hypothetical protein [Chitinophagaceae bacterium]